MGADVVSLTACPETALSRKFRASYRHRSHNGYDYELFCFLRWFYLLDYLDREDLESVFYLDSDVVIYTDLSRLYANGSAAYYVVEKQSSPTHRPGTMRNSYAVGHISFWTREMLQRFCIFLRLDKEEYDKKWRYHVAHGLPGGVEDMDALYLFWRDEGRADIVNLDDVPYLHTFFPNSEVHFRDGLPCTSVNGEEKAWQALHCQGSQNKDFIPKICTLC